MSVCVSMHCYNQSAIVIWYIRVFPFPKVVFTQARKQYILVAAAGNVILKIMSFSIEMTSLSENARSLSLVYMNLKMQRSCELIS